MRCAEPIAWLASLGIHAWLLMPVLAEMGGQSTAEEGAATSIVAVAVVGEQPQAEMPAEPQDEPEIEPEDLEQKMASPVELRPADEPDVTKEDGDSWEESLAEPEGGGEASPASAMVFSDDAVRALNLVLDLSDHDLFLSAAQDLGIRFLIYPPSQSPKWVLELHGSGLESVEQVTPESLNLLSRRAHDLTPDRFFRTIRNRATQSAGFPSTGARLVAAVPAGTDKMFLAAERSYLQQAGPAAAQWRTLHGRLVGAGSTWQLEITGGV
jgi:hypothetical protein